VLSCIGKGLALIRHPPTSPAKCRKGLLLKVNLSLCFNWVPRHERVLGSGGIASRILTLITRWRWVVSFTPQQLHPGGKSPSYLLDRKLCGIQGRCGQGGEEKNSQPLPGFEPPTIQLITPRYFRFGLNQSGQRRPNLWQLKKEFLLKKSQWCFARKELFSLCCSLLEW
jgi:hypothetical protein